MLRSLVHVAVLAASLSSASAFVPSSTQALTQSSSSTALFFGIPTFQPKNDKDDKDGSEPEKKIGLSGLVQLITAGAGSPFLGNYEGTDPETGKMMFSLEANNLVDEAGESKQTKMPYFESGWVSDEDLEKDRQKKADGGFKFPWQN